MIFYIKKMKSRISSDFSTILVLEKKFAYYAEEYNFPSKMKVVFYISFRILNF